MISSLPLLIPTPAADAAHASAHETAARFQHGAYAVACPTCHVPAGVLCLTQHGAHATRWSIHRQNPKRVGLVQLLTRRAR
ncbi:hypothetical protein ACF08W_28780 [Streptomyces sp. NPDC015144]|uniref:hypothetical protein n=1 Tax=Streptomyces sp. NPDC015144 TaxID=3364944 RepID=UPI0036F5AE1F